MAVLTWRNVDAPNFAPVQEGYRNFGNLLANATTGLNAGIDRFQAQQQDQRDRAALGQALQFTDADQLSQAIRSGQVSPEGLSTNALGALGSRVNTLLDQANARQLNQSRQYAQDRLASENQIQDNARAPLARQLGITDPALAALSPEQQQAMLSRSATLRSQNLNNDNRQFQNEEQNRLRELQRVATNTATDIMRQSATADDARNALEASGVLTPEQYAATNQLLSMNFGNLYAPIGGGTAPAGAGGRGRVSAPAGSQGAGTASGSAYDTTFNFQGTTQPVSSMPISQVMGVQDESIRTQGHSPMGAFQINKATIEDFAPKVLGENWKDQPFTPENQEKLAKALFDERKDRDLTKTWASLPNSTPGAYKNYSWEEMRHILALGETGQSLPDNPRSLNDLAGRSAAEISRRVAQNNTIDTVADTQRTLTDTRSPAQVVNDLIGSTFPEGDRRAIAREITRGMADNPGLSAAQVGAALERSFSPASSIPFTRDFVGTTSLGDGVGVNDERFANMLAAAASGRTDYQSLANIDTQARGAGVASAQQSLQTAVQELTALRARQQTQPRLSTDRAEARVARATEALQRALAGQQTDPNLRPVRQ